MKLRRGLPCFVNNPAKWNIWFGIWSEVDFRNLFSNRRSWFGRLLSDICQLHHCTTVVFQRLTHFTRFLFWKNLIINPAKRENTRKCGQAIANTTWFNNITFPADFTINQAIQSARKNEDAGSTGARQMIPKDFRYHAWMDYVQLITVYYNFGKETKKFTILRKGWWGTCITIWVSYM